MTETEHYKFIVIGELTFCIPIIFGYIGTVNASVLYNCTAFYTPEIICYSIVFGPSYLLIIVRS